MLTEEINEAERRINAARKNNAKFLTLGNLHLPVVPESIAQLTQLTVLGLGSNKLTTLPESFAQLTQLTELGLDSNKLTTLPEFFAQLTQLTVLDLSYNQLTTLPESIAQLTQLTELNLFDNQLTTLPKSITQLTQLTELNLRSNKLTTLPESFAQLTQLTELGLDSNKLTTLPESIAQLTQLTKIGLDSNKLTTLPESIAQLTQLTELGLGSNKLTTLPESIAQLTQLTELDLSYNQLTTLPESIAQLTQLTELYLRANKLTTLPESFAQLTQLTELDLSYNQLTTLPESFAQLTQLTELNLSYNKLTTLPESFAQLTQLTKLNLSDNQLTTLPESFAQLTQLTELNLGENPLASPPREIADRGIAAIHDYFDQIKAQDIGYLYEAKLIIVGDPGAGKTTLLNKLIDPKYPVPNHPDSTIGINIQPWSFKADINEAHQLDFRANLWDFGGQKIQYMTHQFFLTSRALYVLLSDDRAQRTNFEYWFNLIEVLGDKSPIVVVLNEIKNQSITNFNSSYFDKHYPGMIKSVRDVDFSKDDGRHETLVKHLRHNLAQLKHIGDPLPKQWIPIRQHLEELQDLHNYISFNEYKAICVEHEIEKESQQLTLSQYLHDIGVILHYQYDRDIAHWIVLKPQWVVDAVYAILSDKTVQHQKGHFEKAWLFDQWQGYTLDERNYLLSLMQKHRFDICYATDNHEEHYIAPQLLPTEESNYTFDKGSNLLFRYQYKFLPFGLTARLIVRLSDDIDQQNGERVQWQTGVVLYHRQGKTRALIEESTSEEGQKIIDIRVSGDKVSCKDYLSRIRAAIEKIHDDSYKEISPDQMIPCNQCLNSEKHATNPRYVPYDELIVFINNNKKRVPCGVCGKEYDPQELVYGIYSRQELESKHFHFPNAKEVTMGDKYETGQAGAVGPGSHAHDINFNQFWQQQKNDIDINLLANDLKILREQLLENAQSPEHYAEIGDIAKAETEANQGNGSKALEYLAKAGKWTWGIAEKTGVGVAIAAAKAKLGL